MPYLNTDEVESALAAASAAPNTAFTQLIALPHLTWEGRACHALKIASGGGTGRIGVYFLGGVHSREWGSPDILISFVEQLTAAYRTNSGITLGGKSFTAAQIQAIVNNLDILVFPQANPDGRHFSMTSDAMWRKNRRPAPAGHAGCPGVDVNRNYDFLWNYPAHFSPSAAVMNSTDPCDYQVYIGPSAVSEPETQNVVWLTDRFSNVRFFVDLHSYGEDILYNWGDDEDQSTDPNMNFRNPAYDGARGIAGDSAYLEYIDACDKSVALDLAGAMQGAIAAVRGRSYLVESGFALYPTAGTSDDYCFSRHFADDSKQKIVSYTLEWGSGSNDTPFHPAYSEMANIIEEVTAGLLQFCLWVHDSQADVYIRDNSDDTGAVPYGGVFWDNSDIFVRATDDDVLAYEPAQRGQTNYVYVRVTNKGPASTRRFTVSLRAVRFPGTEFVYPFDWTTVDATHIQPATVLNSFNGVAPGASVTAKFSLSAAQVEQLWGWESGGTHPCLLAAVDGCNDFGSPVGVHVWENNNLAQRNISVVMAKASEAIKFAFVSGHQSDHSKTFELAIDRSQLPNGIALVLNHFDQHPAFPFIARRSVSPAAAVTPAAAGTLVQPIAGAIAHESTLPAGTLSLPLSATTGLVSSLSGAHFVHAPDHAAIQVTESKATMVWNKEAGESRHFELGFVVPADAKPGHVYRVQVAQRNSAGRTVGGVTLEVHVI
jgi:carboxypeptidase T